MAVKNGNIKWWDLLKNAGNLLAMNQRNLLYIYPHNARKDFPVADNKLLTKDLLVPKGIPMPKTYRVYGSFTELLRLEDDLRYLPGFVIKPAQGSRGSGIVVIKEYKGGRWITPGGRSYSLKELKNHISDIVFGVYSFDLHDQAIVEELICQHPLMEEISPFGLADIRLILLHGGQVLAMMRIPTKLSGGKANLHRGAVGVGVNLENGCTTNAIVKRRVITVHPDTGRDLIDFTIPEWKQILEVGGRVARNLPLKYLGVDIALSVKGPVLLEANVRPGLEIQIANKQGMRNILESVAAQNNERNDN